MSKEQIYLGKPQTYPIEVCTVKSGQKIAITQLIFNNSIATETEQKVTLTINTIDIMTITTKGTADVHDVNIVLKPGDRLLVKQQTEGAVNVMINGTSETEPVSY